MDSKGFLASFRNAVLFTSCIMTYSTAAPLSQSGRWVNPCGESPPAQGTSTLPLPPMSPQPISIELQSLRLMAHTAVSLCEELSNAIEKQSTTSAVDGFRSDPPLQGFPNDSASFTSGLKTSLLHEVERVSKIGVFLEQARLDTHTYTTEIKQLDDKYILMLCKMLTILKGLQQEVTSVVSRDIMPSEYKNMPDIATTNRRNYLIARDAKKIFVAISEGVDKHLKTIS